MVLEEFDRIKVVGKGSYGEVWLVRHKKDRKQYVLKKMNLQRASKRERHSAEQEAKLLSKLKHPNIVSYKDSFETTEGNLYIAMQFCEGGDLYTRLKEQQGVLLVERQVVEWFVQIAMALQYMHERHILHRDLKTQNIFLTKSKIIKVGDLGIARVLDSVTDMATTLIGTPYYMSPELFSNKPYNHKSDVWALGCCVYEMATLKHAFNAKDMNSLVYKILKGKMPQMPKQYSPELNAIIKSLLHQDPDKRPSVNRILRDPFIKKNIAIFLEDTKKNSRRPSSSRISSSSSSRPGSASSSRSESHKAKIPVSNPPSVKIPISNPPCVKPNRDNGDSASVVSVSNVKIDEASGDAQSMSSQRKGHSRKPSDGAKPLEPIKEKLEGKGEVLQSSSESAATTQDTVVPVTIVSNEPEKNQEKKEKPKRRKFLRNLVKSSEIEVSDKSKDTEVKIEPAPKSPPRKTSSPTKPKIIPTPRPLPDYPKAEESSELPKKRDQLTKSKVQKEERSDSSKSSASSVSSSKEEYPNIDLETPRSLPNISARERRRQKNPASASQENPNSARIKLVKVTDHPSANKISKSRPSKDEPDKAKPISKKGMRQPSIKDESSSSDEAMPDNNTEKEKRRENKEINNFISLLDTTLHLNQKNDQSDEDELIPVDIVDSKVNGAAEESKPMNSLTAANKGIGMPSVETLTDSNRLMNRIRLLQTDCIKGVGWEILRKAYDILNKIEEDEVEPQLVELMGKDKFDEYAGKIWQLKFCEESLF